jgi:hypothetical protein
MAVLWGFFWFVGIPLLKNSVFNLTIMVHKSWRATVAAIENQQKSIDSLVAVVLQNRKVLDLLIAAQGGTCAILNETCFLYINMTSKVEENLKFLKKKTIKIIDKAQSTQTPWWGSLFSSLGHSIWLWVLSSWVPSSLWAWPYALTCVSLTA